MPNWKEIDLQAKQWMKEAGEIIKSSLSRTLKIKTKSNPNDLVTEMDQAIEQFFIKNIKETYPGHRIIGEEGFGDKVTQLDGIVWLIDPIDGTVNFVHMQRNFAISIGIYEDGIGRIGLIYDVIRDELYHTIRGNGVFMNDLPLEQLDTVQVPEAIIGLNTTWVTKNTRINPAILGALVKDLRGTRSYGSAALEMASVAAGRLDGYITLRLAPWDFAAGKIMVEELGGYVTDLTGKSINLLGQNSVLVAKPGLYEEILKNYLNNGNW
ncbi:inositol monophosphatase family protein [Bacillus benzoevorans]|uniref:inositol-phosphate phosphatase n=1 Tax=Bacillus benzoevorans TaxID=1456 RepID=A0A7X0HMS6_9BACI|nr:inositol monophosphatase family protein [Bacillus benzoevorans]MBB6443693.1 myo-inositol-1(or 4)-monophosphatase [Bacillus benzoevorans]